MNKSLLHVLRIVALGLLLGVVLYLSYLALGMLP